MDDFGDAFDDLDQLVKDTGYDAEEGLEGDTEDVVQPSTGITLIQGLNKMKLDNFAVDEVDNKEQVDLNLDFAALGNVDISAQDTQDTSVVATNIVYVEDVEAAQQMAADLGDLGDILGDLANTDDEVAAAIDKSIKIAPIIVQKASAPTHKAMVVDSETGAVTVDAGLPAMNGMVLPAPVAPPVPRPEPAGKNVVYSLQLVDGTVKKVSIDNKETARELLFLFADKNRLRNTEMFGLFESGPNVSRWVNLDSRLRDLDLPEWVGPASDNAATKIIMKIRYFKRMKKEYSDPMADHLYYLQVKDDVLSGKFYTSEGVAIRLGAYSLQEFYGDHQPGKHEVGFLDEVGIDKFVPAPHIKSNPSRYWQKRLFHLHVKCKGMSKEVAERKYVELARGLPSFGASIFTVYSVGMPPHYTESPTLLGVAEDGLIVMDNTHTDTGGQWTFYSFDVLRGWIQKEEDKRILEVQKPNAQMEMLLDLLTFKAEPKVVESIVLMLNEYRYLLHPYRHESYREADPTQKLSRALPPPLLFEIPSKRSLLHPERSRLEIFKNEYIRSCLSTNSKPLPRIYLRVDDCLDNGTALEALDLTKCGLTLDSFAVLAKPINRAFASDAAHKDENFTENFSIKSLDLSGNELWPKGFLSLAMILESGTVTHLDISSTKLHDSVDGFIDCMRMTMVNPLTNDRIQNASLITELVLSDNALKLQSMTKILNCFKDSCHLVSIDLSDNGLDDACMDVLEPFLSNNRSALTSLELSNNKFTDKAAIAMAGYVQKNDCSRLRVLGLGTNKITTKGALELINVIWKQGVLTTLKMSRNDLGLKFALQLADLLGQKSFLKSLTLNQCNLEKKGCRAIAFALSKNTSLVTLNLSNNDMDDEAAKQLFTSLSTTNRSLTSLTLMQNPLGAKGAGDVVKILNSNDRITTLDLSFCKVGNDQIKKLSDILVTHHTLQVLALIGNELGKTGAKYMCTIIKGNNSLKKVFLDNNQIPEKTGKELAEALNENHSITHLSLKDNLLDREGIIDLVTGVPNNTTLVRVELAGNPGAEYEAEIKELAKKSTRILFQLKGAENK